MHNTTTNHTTFAIRKMREDDLKWVREWYENFSIPGLPLADGDPVDVKKIFQERVRYLILDATTNRPVGVFVVNVPQDNVVKVGFGDRQYATDDCRRILTQTIRSWMKTHYPKTVPDIRFV